MGKKVDTAKHIFINVLKTYGGILIGGGLALFVFTQLLHATTIFIYFVFASVIIGLVLPTLIFVHYHTMIEMYSGKLVYGLSRLNMTITHRQAMTSTISTCAIFTLMYSIYAIATGHLGVGCISLIIPAFLASLFIWQTRIIYRMASELFTSTVGESPIKGRNVFSASNRILFLGAVMTGLLVGFIYFLIWENEILIGIPLLIGGLIFFVFLSREVPKAVQKLKLPEMIEVIKGDESLDE